MGLAWATLAVAGAMTLLAGSVAPAGEISASGERMPTTELVSRSFAGGIPNGPSANPAMSGDRRFARHIAFESEASDLVGGDTNGHKDVFLIVRGGGFGNSGSPWEPGRTMLVSRGRGGRPANGPSFAPALDGSFRDRPRCVAFLSAASNLVRGDTNGRVDAFVAKAPGFRPRRVSLPRRRQARRDTNDVAVSGDCSRVSFVLGRRLYTRVGRRTRRVRARGPEADPFYATGATNDLVFGARAGVYLSKHGTRRARLVARGGRNPGYNGLKRRTLAYEKDIGGRSQIAYRDIGEPEQVLTRGGDGDSRDPYVGNSGFFVLFESDATNLETGTGGPDRNGRTDAYLYTDTRKVTVAESVDHSRALLPGGGRDPAMNWYRNYVLFESPAPLGGDGPPQIFMRYQGGI